MAKNSETDLNFSPFPLLKRDKYAWTGKILLPSWRGFQARQGAYGAVSSRKASDGTAHLDVIPLEDRGTQSPTPEQAAAFQFLIDHEPAIHSSVLHAIFGAYPGMQYSYDYDDEEAEELMPAIDTPDQLKRLLGLSTVNILPATKDGVAYVGFEFGCTWDSEHGLGVMTHRERIVKIGGADASFLEWIAEKDANE
jgi:hypothetical protein